MSRTLATVMLAGGLLAAGQAVAEDHDMTPTHETDSGPLLWHNESLTYLYGKNFKINPPIQQTFTLEHASGWTWGDLFIFFDHRSTTTARKTPATARTPTTARSLRA